MIKRRFRHQDIAAVPRRTQHAYKLGIYLMDNPTYELWIRGPGESMERIGRVHVSELDELVVKLFRESALKPIGPSRID